MPDVEIDDDPVDVKEATIVYESDLRAAAHSNGVAHDLVGASVREEVDGGGPGLPEEPSWHDRRPDRQPRSLGMSLLIASAYLGFGGLMVYAGALVLKDAWTDRREKKS